MSSAADLFNSVAELPLFPRSLIDTQAEEALAELCARAGVRTIIEVGTFLGMGSTQVFCRALPPEGRLYCVDTFCVNMIRFQRPENTHYHAFLSNMKQTGVADKIVPVRMTSLEAAKALAVTADLVFIDGDHREEAVIADIEAWRPHVRPGGILCGDDYNVEPCPGVAPAVRRALPGHQVNGRIWWTEISAPAPGPNSITK
jgi:predicted O-methyltransferase YrrM